MVRAGAQVVAVVTVFALGIALGHTTGARDGPVGGPSVQAVDRREAAPGGLLRLVATSGSGRAVVVDHTVGDGRRVKYEVPSGWATFVPAPPLFRSGFFRVTAGSRTMVDQATDSVRCRVYDQAGNLVTDTTVAGTYESADCGGF